MAGESVRVLLECSLWVWDRDDESTPKTWQPRWCSVTKHSNRSNSRIRMRLNRSGPNIPIECQNHEVPMENYAGLEVFNAPFEGKLHGFALVTFYRTYHFAVSSAEVVKAWVDCIVNEIGFEWKFDVRVLATQNIVPPGEATMRFYPRFFSLTSGTVHGGVSATVPACLGLWQHNHLRRYGGSQGFSFESGSRSIGGPEVYRLATHQGSTIKDLFDCVAHGKPLPFNDTVSMYSTTEDPAVSAAAAAATTPQPARPKGRGEEYDYVAVDVPRRPNRVVDRDVNYLSIQVAGGTTNAPGTTGGPGGSVTSPPHTAEHTTSPSPPAQAVASAAGSTIYSGVDLQKTAQLRDALVHSHRR